MPTRQQIAAAQHLAEMEFDLQQDIRLERRPTFGTGRMRRTAKCILLAAVAMQRGGLPDGSVIVVADSFTVEGEQIDLRSRGCWVDLGGDLDGWSWEPVECTMMPTPERWRRGDPQEVVKFASVAELRAACLANGYIPGDRWSYIVALNALINGGVPASGELQWEERPGLVISDVPRRPPRPATKSTWGNGLSPERLRELGAQGATTQSGGDITLRNRYKWDDPATCFERAEGQI